MSLLSGAAAKPQQGGVFISASPGPFTNCNTFEGNSRATNITLDHVYGSLVRLDYAKGGHIPDVGQDALFDQLSATGDLAKEKVIVGRLQQLVLANDLELGIVARSRSRGATMGRWLPAAGSVEPDVTASATRLWIDRSKLPAKRKGS